MEWLKSIKQVCYEKPHIPISLASVISFLMFLQNLAVFMSDGILDSNELHQLLTSANGFETVLLFVIMIFIKER